MQLSSRERLVVGGAVVLVVFSLFMIGGSGESGATTDVIRGPISETVSVTGQLEP